MLLFILIIFLIIFIFYFFNYKKSLSLKKEYYRINNDNLNKLSKGNNKLSIKLFNILNKNDKDNLNDFVFSPLSITFALSLIHLGVKNKSENELNDLFDYKYSLTELKQILKIFNNKNIKITNLIIINETKKINKNYIKSIKNLSTLNIDNFDNKINIVNKTNNFIEKNTNGLIKEVISINDVDASNILILINTVYFKSDWEKKFNKNKTIKLPFNNKQENLVNMMHQTNKYLYYENDQMQIIEMFYKDNNFIMGVILPKNKENIYNLYNHNFNNLIENLKYEEVELFLPKFKQKKNIKMIPLLKKLGVNDIFNENNDLENISSKMYVSNIIHEAIIIVDESGTEAAATTVINIKAMAMRSNIKLFKADHSFIYYVRHIPTNMILFLGIFNGNE